MLPAIDGRAQRDHERAIRNFYNSASGMPPVRFVAEADSLLTNYQDLQQIVLIRHGKPDLPRRRWMKRNQFEQYIAAYDTVGVQSFDDQPFRRDVPLQHVFTSKLNRAVHSACLIFGVDMRLVSDKRFNEFERKAMAFPNMKMPFGFWSAGGRFLWVLGCNDKGIESFSDARFRAYYNALFLEQEAVKHGKALLVAHGFMNRYIAKSLKKRGWEVVDLNGKSYFGCYIAYRIK
jgi:broad specificity phosphatase PhoE